MARQAKCSYMNDVKWREVLTTLATHHVAARIKLTSYDYVAEAGPGEDSIASWSASDYHLAQSQPISQKSPKYWDGPSIGPFTTSEIEWLAIPTSSLEAIRDELPENLQIVQRGSETIILGYGY